MGLHSGVEGSDILLDIRARMAREGLTRPFITLSYAQSIDGSIAAMPDRPLSISCRKSQALTHVLRGLHQAILIGIGTVLSDDPSLDIRYAEGINPQPVILDSRLRFPLYSRMLQGSRQPWIFTGTPADPARARSLERAGARIVQLPVMKDGRLDLDALLSFLFERGIGTLMVEGGSRIITSFLAGRLIDQVVITIAPFFIGGMRAVSRLDSTPLPRLGNLAYVRVGDDLVIVADPLWSCA